jgi:hypothetical protein
MKENEGPGNRVPLEISSRKGVRKKSDLSTFNCSVFISGDGRKDDNGGKERV